MPFLCHIYVEKTDIFFMVIYPFRKTASLRIRRLNVDALRATKKKTPKAAVDSECLKAAVGLLTYISGTWHKESCTWLLLFVTIFSLKNCFSTFYQANMKWHQFHMNFWPVPLFIHQSGDANFGWSDDHPIPIIFWWSRDVETRHISIWLVVKKPSWKKILSMGFG